MAARTRAFLAEFRAAPLDRRALSPDDGLCPVDERWAPLPSTRSAALFLLPELFFGLCAEWMEDAGLLDAVEPGWIPSTLCARLVASASALVSTAKTIQPEPNFVIRSST